MTESGPPIAWLSSSGVMRGAYGPPVQLALKGRSVESSRGFAVSPDGRTAVCAFSEPPELHGRDTRVMAFSLETGAELWPAAVDGTTIVGIASGGSGNLVVWVADDGYDELPFTAYNIASGAAVMTRPHEEGCCYAIIAAGPWRDYMLSHSYEQVTLCAPGSTEPVWQIETTEEISAPERILTTSGEWFCLDGRGACRLCSLRDGQPVPSVLDRIRYEDLLTLLAVYDPTRAFACKSDNPDLAPHHSCRQRFVAVGREQIAGDRYTTADYEVTVLPSRGATEVIVYHHECIRIVRPCGTIVEKRSTPGIVAAWRWSALDCARRGRDEVARAVAAVDELADDVSDLAAVSLVRAVLVGFVAEDARLTALRLAHGQ